MKMEELFAKAKELLIAAKALLEGDEPDMEQVGKLQVEAGALKARAEAMKAVAGGLAEIGTPQMPAALPVGAEEELPGEEDEDTVIKAANVLRFGVTDDPTAVVMREIYGGDYRQALHEQGQAFKTFLRTGRAGSPLSRQIWGPGDVVAMLRDGVSVAEIKSTMVEGTDVLGGYAVPPHVMGGIVARMKGLTAVRDGGALVVQTSSKMIEWLRLTGGGDQYPTAMRGLWGAETDSPTGDDFTFGLLQIPVHVYTYKVAFSVSLLEDAANIVQVFTNLVADTMAIDEDSVYLTGDGSGRPRGFLPSSANADSLSEVNSENASALTMDGLKKLRRGIASQYRAPGRATWIGNSDTGADIEVMKDGDGRYFVDDLTVGEKFMGGTWRESEAMPDVSADAFPLIFGDMSGYAIIERLGMAIRRYNDSNTGINVTEFHIRRRLGGHVIEPWKFAVQKTSA